ncbi:hypothetical protein [Paraburkholderia haematera]|uniref:Uncharacterized protein n=1 Tax=Paraburkholderia haematera TaxID=2793077 RepID=A0ABM8QXY3_9BURK|nr:hypothetical protein [Paraburkholderia haematera]CAE6722203.1 hypothetical protein R69888_01663 [Paraburkholderia haematera]
MFNDPDLPRSAEERPDTEFDAGVEPSFEAGAEPLATAPPVRFGRLALFVAAASALAFGVVGTVAYGVWFNHDQQAYAEAMAGARQALGTAASASVGQAVAKSSAPPGPAIAAAAQRSAAATATATAATATPSDGEEGGKDASWTGPVTRVPGLASRQTSVADATPAVAASSVPAAQLAAPPSNPAVQQLASGRPGKDARLAQQDRRSSSTANSRHKGSLFARIGSFFRRVSYRQHGTGSQQDNYSHP